MKMTKKEYPKEYEEMAEEIERDFPPEKELKTFHEVITSYIGFNHVLHEEFDDFIQKLKEDMRKDKVILPRCTTFMEKIIDKRAGGLGAK
jgi:hypothetical protein